MKKSIKRLLGATCALALLAGAGVVLGSISKDAVKVRADTLYTLESKTFSKNSSYGSTYTETINDVEWDIAANMSTTGFWRIGGKSLAATDRIFESNAAISGTVASITINHKGISRNEVSVAYVDLDVASDSSFGTIVESVHLTPSFSKSTSGSFTFDSSETWADCYYRFTFNVANSSGSNGGLDFVSAVFNGESGGGATLESISVSGSMTKTSYCVGESWSPAGLTVTAYYDDESSKDVSSSANWTYSPAAPAEGITSVVATASYGGKTASSSAQAVTVTKTNPIQVLYTKSSGASVDVYGYYVGFLDGTGPVIMDGEYGIVVYNKTADVSGYTAGETILHVTGSISIYKGLYEIGSPSMSIATGTYVVPATPVVYSTNGSETAEYASRLTTVTGTPTVTKGSFESAAGTADITMSFAVNSKTVQVFYKKAAQTADAEAFAAIKTAVAGSSEITIKGFTGWFDGFQVQMNGYVKPADDYTAGDFAQDLLDLVLPICTASQEGNKDALTIVWNDLQGDDKYPSLPGSEKTILRDADADIDGDTIAKAMHYYDWCVVKYNLGNFIERDSISGLVASNNIFNNTVNSSTFIIVVTVVALISVTSIGALVVIKRHKAN